MIRNAMRKELAAMLTAFPEKRLPAIRRSLKEEWLYTTDLPILYGGTVPGLLAESLSAASWEFIQEGNWLQLRKPAPEPPENWYTGMFGPEAACCRSLMDRHSARFAEADKAAEAAQRMLIKAGEEGSKAYEEACAVLHRKWAERLRLGKTLPTVSRRYFGT